MRHGRLQGQVALITGGGSGLGLALVQRFLQEGARGVAVLEKSEDKAAALRDRFGSSVCVTCGSAATMADNLRAVQSALQAFERLDTFIGNAGLWDANISLLDLELDRIEPAFAELFALNVGGYLLGAKACAEALLRSCGSMIFTLSNAAFLPGGGGPLYTASKHAGVGLVRQLAYELAPKVRVNGVAPGAMETDLRGPGALGLADSRLLAGRRADEVAAIMPLQIRPEAEHYAGAYVWLASRDDATTVTGDIVRADCGLAIRGIRQVAGGLHL